MSLLRITRNAENVSNFNEYTEFDNPLFSQSTLEFNSDKISEDNFSDDSSSEMVSNEDNNTEQILASVENPNRVIDDINNEANLIIENAKKEALEIKENAQKELENIQKDINILREQIEKEAYEEGFNLGQDEGYKAGLNRGEAEIKSSYKQEYLDFRNSISDQIIELEKEKQQFLDKYIEDLKDVSISIAEKIVHANLKGHAEVVSRMILAATEKMKKTSWAKIYIGQDEESVTIQGNREFLNSISRIADQVKVVFVDEEGTCIVETPEGIIDLSVKTQIENVRDILKKENA